MMKHNNLYRGGGQGNCLNLFRLFACIQVMIGHMNFHLNLQTPVILQPFLFIFKGVPIFFILSGFLIWQSIERTKDFKTFLTKRVLRLYPELWLCLIFELLSIILFSGCNIPITDYLAFGFTQGTVFQFWTPDSMRPYGCGTPNGSLWTICVIVQFYLVAWFIRKPMSKLSIRWWVLILTCSVLIALWSPNTLPIPEVAKKLYGQTLLRYGWIFLLGAFISNFFTQFIGILKKFWYVPLISMIALYLLHWDINVAMYPLVQTIMLSLFIIGFAYQFKKLEFKTDISYGVYIYHMIFVNIAIQLGYVCDWRAYGVIVLTTLIFGYMSTKFGILIRKKVL